MIQEGIKHKEGENPVAAGEGCSGNSFIPFYLSRGLSANEGLPAGLPAVGYHQGYQTFKCPSSPNPWIWLLVIPVAQSSTYQAHIPFCN